MPFRALLCLAGFKVRIFLETSKLTVTQFYRIPQRGLELLKGLPMFLEGYMDKVQALSLQVSPSSTFDFSPLFCPKTDSMILLCMWWKEYIESHFARVYKWWHFYILPLILRL